MKQTLKHILAVYKVKRSRRRLIDFSELEFKQAGKHCPSSNDSLFFAGISKEGFTFVSRMAFRSDHKNENWLAVSIPGEGIWSFKNLSLREGAGFKQGNLEYRCTESGEKWQVKYDGKLYQEDAEQDFKLDVTWTAATPMIQVNEFGESDVKLGKQISQQNWNWCLKKKLGVLDLLNYEQAGKMAGTLSLSGKNHKLDFVGIRYHERGINNWQDRAQHYRIAAVLENGHFLNINLVDYSFLKNHLAAFIYDDDSIHKIDQISSLNDLDTNLSGSFTLDLKQENKKEARQLLIEPLTVFNYRVTKSYQIKLAEAAFTYDGVKGIGIVETGHKINS